MGDVEHGKSEEQKKRVEEDEFGEKKIPRNSDPRQLSEQERKEHEMTHLPFRSWCRHCIKGMEPAEDCRKATEEERVGQVPEIQSNYTFMDNEKEG